MWAVSWENGALVECNWKPHQCEILIKSEMERLRAEYVGTGWDVADVQTAYDELVTTPGALFVFVGPNVMCLCEDRPWFSKERVLYEEFIGMGIGLATVVDVMKAVCKIVDVKRYVAGTRAAANQRHAGLAKCYSMEGLTISAIELMGVIHGQENPQGGSEV